MLDGRVLGASQVEYKPFGKLPVKREWLGSWLAFWLVWLGFWLAFWLVWFGSWLAFWLVWFEPESQPEAKPSQPEANQKSQPGFPLRALALQKQRQLLGILPNRISRSLYFAASRLHAAF